jgi:RNA polymerase sigma-70 factor (ECF subfamily)
MELNDKSSEAIGPLDPERTAQFVELYSQHYPKLQYFLMALLPTSNDAADVMQETSLVLWRKFDTFEIGTNFFAWACKIARLQTLKHFQRNHRSTKLFENQTLEKIATDALQAAERNSVPLELLESCLQKLPESDRKIIRRRYEAGVTVKQIAAEIGLSANLLSKSLGRMRRALLACIERKLAEDT